VEEGLLRMRWGWWRRDILVYRRRKFDIPLHGRVAVFFYRSKGALWKLAAKACLGGFWMRVYFIRYPVPLSREGLFYSLCCC
jgi:hypothetical protein